jgi:hypothetical protein
MCLFNGSEGNASGETSQLGGASSMSLNRLKQREEDLLLQIGYVASVLAL